MAEITDYFGKTSIDSDYAVATTVDTARTAGVTVLEAFDLSKYTEDTPVYFVTYKKTTDPLTNEVLIENLVSWKGLVNSDANTITNMTVAPGYVDLGNDVGDFIELVPTDYWANSLMNGIFVGHNPDGKLKKNAPIDSPQASLANITPVGSVLDFAGAAAPTGWLLCYGQAISREDYSDLFSVIGTTYGVGNGSTTFNLPDLRGRVVAGQDDMGGTSADRLTNPAGTTGGIDGDVLGGTGGSETHLLTSAQSGLRAHTHNVNKAASAGGDGSGLAYSSTSLANNTGIHNSSALDATNAHNNVQPTIILNKIIKY